MEFRDFSLLVRDTKVREFVDGLARGELLASKCASCGAIEYPPRSDCPRCYGTEFAWTPIRGAGRLVSFTSVFVTPAHFTPDLCATAPFSAYAYNPAPVGIVELEGGLRVMGWILGVNLKSLRVGMRFAPRPEILPDGRATVVLQQAEG
ncbi:MAG: Zn-ribbon domain-containing OB-fold protein [Candidatus Bipolaricaulis sp.]|nr:Zn-ribbon domain-containing OB-fold protein [Candidatus Bipolaricaulis sp.]